MAQYTVQYTTKQERDSAITLAESQLHQMIHDNFGTGPNGENELVFEDTPNTTPRPKPPEEIELDNLRSKIKSRNITLSDLVRYTELRDRI